MSANFEAKKAVVEEIKEKINASKSVVLVHYERLTVAEVTDLRNKFRAANSEYKVYKNTLVRKAFDELGVNDFDNDLNGATAFVFCPDETSGCSILAKAVKDAPQLDTNRERCSSPRCSGACRLPSQISPMCSARSRKTRNNFHKTGGYSKWMFRSLSKKSRR